jgi:hypothetical protein
MARTTFGPTAAMTHPLAQSHPLDEGGRTAPNMRYRSIKATGRNKVSHWADLVADF